MPALCDPTFEATVSPLLIRLLGGRAEREPGPAKVGPLPPATLVGPNPEDACSEGDGFTQDAPFAPVRLRRDGTRPLEGHGALLWEDRSRIPLPGWDANGVVRTLRLYLSEDGGLMAQIAYHPEDGLPARPVWRAERIGEPYEFRNFLARSGGAACFLAAGVILTSADVIASRLDPLGGPVPTVPPFMPDPAQSEGFIT